MGKGKAHRSGNRRNRSRVGEGAQARGQHRPQLPRRVRLVCRRRRQLFKRLSRLDERAAPRNLCGLRGPRDPLRRQEMVGDLVLPAAVVRFAEPRRGRRAGWFMLDRVIGKHDFITYALALGSDGSVRGLEILEYRETYGGEIRNPNWRRQFVGARPGSALRLDKDIKNISGATLSSRHVTDGVRRLLVTWQMLLANS